MSLIKIKTLTEYLQKPAYQIQEIEKTKQVGTFYLSEWVHAVVHHNQ